MRDVYYLHGFVVRRDRDDSTEAYFPFMADTPTVEAEKKAFAQAWEYVQSRCAIYFYSKHERTVVEEPPAKVSCGGSRRRHGCYVRLASSCGPLL